MPTDPAPRRSPPGATGRGVVLSPAVIPIALTVTWPKLTRAGVFAGSLAGAVLGKIVVLCLLILFIQRRPRGLFPLKGRAVEA